MISKEQFEKEYCENSNISINYYYDHFITLPCACNYEDCRGWAAVHKNEFSIKTHMELYAPKTSTQN